MAASIIPDEWMNGGVVADRTNAVINALLDWAAKSDVNVLTRKNVEDAVKHAARVEAEETVSDYVSRVTSNGPFELEDPGKWRIKWGEVERA